MSVFGKYPRVILNSEALITKFKVGGVSVVPGTWPILLQDPVPSLCLSTERERKVLHNMSSTCFGHNPAPSEPGQKGSCAQNPGMS